MTQPVEQDDPTRVLQGPLACVARVSLAGEFFYGAREGGLEVDQLRPVDVTTILTTRSYSERASAYHSARCSRCPPGFVVATLDGLHVDEADDLIAGPHRIHQSDIVFPTTETGPKPGAAPGE